LIAAGVAAVNALVLMVMGRNVTAGSKGDCLYTALKKSGMYRMSL